MKKLIILSVLAVLVCTIFATNPRVYMQKVTLDDGSMPGNPADTNPIPNYIYEIYNSAEPTNVVATNTSTNPPNICLKKTGNGTTVPYYVVAYVNQSQFNNVWPIGSTLYCKVIYVPTGEFVTWTREVPSGSTILDTTIPYIVPPYSAPSYTLTVTSTPDGKPIYKDNVDTGQVTPYTFDPGEAGTYKVVDPLYTWNPTETVVPELTENTTINFVGTLIPDTYTYTLNIHGPEGGYAVTGPTAALSGTIPYIKTANVVADLLGDYTVADAPAGFQWVMNPITVSADMFSLVAKKNGGMNKVVLGSRTNGAKANYEYAATITFELEQLPPQNYTVLITSLPVGAEIYVGGVDTGEITPYTFTLAAGANATYTVMMDHYTWEPADFAVTNISENKSCNFVGTFNFTQGEEITPPGVPSGSAITIEFTQGSAIVITGTPTSAVNPGWIPGYIQFMTLLGAGPWQLTINTSYSFVWIVGVGVYTGPFPMTIDIPAGGKNSDVEIQYGDGGDPTLPVELSYFAATLTAENFVNIAWTTQTETNMNGFNIYRSDSDILSSAIQIAYIPATNTSTTQNYKHIDREVENGNTYYYWLECVETNGQSIFNGPSSVYVDGPTTPELPNCTTMNNAYPNPFRAGEGTTIKVNVKAGDNGTVTIYNILGQVVKTFPVNQGSNNLTWNARDSKGNLCGNGIYFYKLSTNSLNQTKKMVIVK
ncbi:MAG TPA: T9SS type A sorting domain-containing protein [Candidatus Cloacimonas sp.]|nr:T9SS type A sorting domain-containing protein [Candidatus Cloacimonas sp.]